MAERAGFRKVRKLLNDPTAKYQVPPYQRGYEWRDNEWKDLWLDIQRLEEQAGNHFLGNIILLEKENDTYEIVDGQQRITTISILLMAIRDSDHWNGSKEDARIGPLISYQVSGTDQQRRLHLNDPELDKSYESLWSGSPEDANGQIEGAYTYYTTKLQGLSHDQIDDLLDKLVDNIRVVRTKVEDPALAYPIFQSQNARGKDVEPHILATSRVHGEAHKLQNKHEKDRIIRKWDGIYEELGETLGRPRYRRDISIRRPMSHILSVSEKQTVTEITKSILYENFERVINSYNSVSEFVDWFDDEKDIYLKVASSSDDVSGGRLSNETVRYIQYLNCAPSHAEILSYLLYKKIDSEELLKELLYLCATFSMRYELADADNRRLKDEIYSIAAHLKEKDNPTEIRKYLKSKIKNDTPEEGQIIETLKQRKMNMGPWKFRTRLILVSIEESRESTKRVNLNDIHIDHISPRNTFTNDDYYEWKRRHGEDGFSERCMKIGNLALLTGSEHAQLKESSFNDKMNTYTNSEISTTRGVVKTAEKNDGWDDEAIEKRTELMAQELTNYWSV